MKKQKIHQVLATLGYGDAIGHEVLGIQRVLRSAGAPSDADLADAVIDAMVDDTETGLGVGAPADLVVVPADTVAAAVMDHPPRSAVFFRGRLVARDGHLV